MENISKRYWISPTHNLKVLRAKALYTKQEKTKITESEIVRRLIDKGLTPKGEFLNKV